MPRSACESCRPAGLGLERKRATDVAKAEREVAKAEKAAAEARENLAVLKAGQ